jgi:hypothetical protein
MADDASVSHEPRPVPAVQREEGREASRDNPFAALRDPPASPLEPTRTHPVDPQQLLALAGATGFSVPSRQSAAVPVPPPPSTEPEAISFRMPLRRTQRARRTTTGRDRQINIKATSDVIDRMQNLADDLNMPLGELLEHAIDYLEEHPPAAKRRR